MNLPAFAHLLRISQPRRLWKRPKAALDRNHPVPGTKRADPPSTLKHNLPGCLVTLLLAGLPLLAHASEVGHIMDSFFSLVKMAVGLLAGLILLLFLLVKAVTRK